MYPLTETSLLALLRDAGLAKDQIPIIRLLFAAISEGHTALKLEADAVPSWELIISQGELKDLLAVNIGFLQIKRHEAQERRVAETLKKLAKTPNDFIELHPNQFMPQADTSQSKAISGSSHQRLSIILGGPGTGKTSTAAAIIAAKRYAMPKLRKVALLAPTGKAAARLTETFHEAISSTPKPDKELLEISASTIHRQLQSLSTMDLILVDEASMVSLDLMDRLLKQLGPDTHLVLMGDPNQLVSVEAGCILRSIERARRLSNNCFKLKKRHRIDGNNVLFELQDLCLTGESAEFIEALRDHRIFWESTQSVKRISDEIRSRLTPYFQEISQSKIPNEPDFQCLTGMTEGIAGRRWINHFVRDELQTRSFHDRGERILITENQRDLGIFNGDIGVVVDKDRSGQEQVYFPMLSQYLLRGQLGATEPAWAISIHRSQGSEYPSVLISLPEPESAKSRFNPTRQLLYTGLTRAKNDICLVSTEAMLHRTLNESSRRISCLEYFLNEN